MKKNSTTKLFAPLSMLLYLSFFLFLHNLKLPSFSIREPPTLVTTETPSQLLPLLLNNTQGFSLPCTNRTAWSSIKPYFYPGFASFYDRMAAVPAEPWSNLTYTEYNRTGIRVNADRMMKNRTDTLYNLVMRECYFWDGKYVAKIDSFLREISTQPTWTFSAHDFGLKYWSAGKFTLDLGSTEAARLIGQVLYMMGNKLSNSTISVAKKAVDQRIFSILRNGGFSPTNPAATRIFLENNWSAVCLSGNFLGRYEY